MTSSTLVERVCINYEDFTEGFLTCSTCLCTYDATDHYPKLLHCSHTVCKSCLEKIVSLPGVREAGSFRCPICRETISLPRGGVMNLPPSFLVNQLLDLMSSQKREVIPKCSTHNQQELLFCESCDVVFCRVCHQGSHNNVLSRQISDSNERKESKAHSQEHTVITFSIAIKRMSEILVYKGHQCNAKLNEAQENVKNEMRKLDQNCDHVYEDINRTFQEIINIVDRRRTELLALTKKTREDKNRILEDQLQFIEAEKCKVEDEINSLQFDQEVKNITKKINDLGEKIESLSHLLDPQENCFIRYDHLHNEAVEGIQTAVSDFGSIRTSKTFPPLCVASVTKSSAHLRASAIITTYDNSGERQRFGGDPVSVDIRHEDGTCVSSRLIDNRDGTYEANFIPPKGGQYCLKVSIFGRPIKTYPILFDASNDINPHCIYGCRGPDTHQFNQPVGLTVNPRNGNVYILDTGNGRIKVLAQTNTINSPFTFVSHIEGNGLENKSATGIALNRDCKSLLISNWRDRNIIEVDLKGNLLRYFTHPELVEPTHLSMNSKEDIIVADNGAQSIFIFHSSGKLSRKIPSNSVSLSTVPVVMSAIAIGPDDEVIMADSCIHVFSSEGIKVREIFPEGRGRGTYGGIFVDSKLYLVATRIEKNKSFIQVFDYSSGSLKFVINSTEAKLKRPSSIAGTSDFHAIVVDLGNDCIKKYRYH